VIYLLLLLFFIFIFLKKVQFSYVCYLCKLVASFLLQITFSCFFLLKVLCKYYPEVMITSPCIGRQGKALRRRQQRKVESRLHHKPIAGPYLHSNRKESCPNIDPTDPETGKRWVQHRFRRSIRIPVEISLAPSVSPSTKGEKNLS
jgi:hypothetical protein